MHSNRLLGLAAAVVVVLAACAQPAHSNSFFDHVKRPFQSTYRKARNLRERAFNRGRQVSENVSGRQGLQALVQPRSADGSEGLEHTARSSRSGGGGGGDNGTGEDFSAMCVFSRGPSMKKPPTLFYFSPQMNAHGCEVQVELELATVNDNRDLDEGFSRDSIQSKLLDSRLYDPAKPTYVLTHGFLASWNSGNWMCDTKDLILDNSEANVFIVDWSGGSKPMLPIDYGASVSNTEYVASLIGDFLAMLMRMTGQTDAKRFRLIGHSLGAHISGFIGYRLGSVGQITGLDPAGPCFSTRSGDEGAQAAETGLLADGTRRLSPKSADHVLALHTDTALFGLKENCGHYDVYVNGGLRQPGCAEASVAGRFNELISGNLKDTFDLNIACAHSYAHNLLDRFLAFATLNEIKNKLFGLSRARPAAPGLSSSTTGGERGKLDKCYPMAYECATWDAYKAGECGFCRDNDRHCVYTGLSLENFQAQRAGAESEYLLAAETAKEDDGSGENDNELNGENDTQGDSDKDNKEQPKFETTRRNSRGQHFIRTTDGELTCLFEYQIVVAARRAQVEQAGENAHHLYFYLQLPLERSGRLTGNDGPERHTRLVQVSHRVDPESPVHTNLRTAYLEALRERVPDANLNEAAAQGLDFYTALITFRQKPEAECKPEDETNGQADSRDKWQLCDTLDTMSEARLWSPSKEKLEATAWVSMNYMSGISYDQRMTKSFVMARAAEPATDRDQLDERQRAKLADLEPDKSRSFGNTMDEAKDRADCLVHALQSNSHRKVKCRRDSEELGFVLNLTPRKL